MNETRQQRLLELRKVEFDAWSRVNSVALRGFRPGHGGDTLGDYGIDNLLRDFGKFLETPSGRIVITALIAAMLLTACAPAATSPTSAGDIPHLHPGVTIGPEHPPAATAMTAGPEQPNLDLTQIATLSLTETPRQPATQEAQFFSLPALLPSIGGQGRLETIPNPAIASDLASSLAKDYIILYGSVIDGAEIAGNQTNLSGIRLCSATGCFAVSSVFPEKIAGDDGREYGYSPQDSQDGAIIYRSPGTRSQLVFVNRFPDRTAAGLRFVTGVDRRDGSLLGLWVDSRGRVIDTVSHVRSLSGTERLVVDLDNGLVQVGNELIEIGRPAWQALTEDQNLLTAGQWNRVEGVTVLPDGKLEIKGSGVPDGWNTPVNSLVKLTEIKGDFGIKTSLKANPDSQYAGVILVEGQRASGEWWKTKRLDVSIRNGGDGIWIGYWDGTKPSAETIAELTGLSLDPDSFHDFELRFSVEKNQVAVWVDGTRVGAGSLGQLLNQRRLKIGFNADPEAVLTVSGLNIEVPEGGNGNLVVAGLTGGALTTAEPGNGQPTPAGVIPTREAATTAVVPPKPEPKVTPDISECDRSRAEYAVCLTGGPVAEWNSQITSPALVTFDNPAVEGDENGPQMPIEEVVAMINAGEVKLGDIKYTITRATWSYAIGYDGTFHWTPNPAVWVFIQPK